MELYSVTNRKGNVYSMTPDKLGTDPLSRALCADALLKEAVEADRHRGV